MSKDAPEIFVWISQAATSEISPKMILFLKFFFGEISAKSRRILGEQYQFNGSREGATLAKLNFKLK
jgi:hypothetical protein